MLFGQSIKLEGKGKKVVAVVGIVIIAKIVGTVFDIDFYSF